MNSTIVCIPDLLSDGWQKQTFAPFRKGVEICMLHDGTVTNSPDSSPAPLEEQPSIALLKYEPEASVPRHRHTGVETILVLSGSQSDERDRYYAGAIVINPVGSSHSVWSVEGCVVLIQWDRPVEFY